jgi:hypothetical protein
MDETSVAQANDGDFTTGFTEHAEAEVSDRLLQGRTAEAMWRGENTVSDVFCFPVELTKLVRHRYCAESFHLIASGSIA